MVLHHTKIVLGGIVILNQMVPSMPLPNDVRAVGTHRLHLDDVVRPNVVLTPGGITGDLGVTSRLQRFLLCSLFPGDHEDVAVWHRFDVMVRDVQIAVVRPRPFQRTVP